MISPLRTRDRRRSEACVANNDDTVEVFNAQQIGDSPPLRRFGRLAQLNRPVAVAMDTVNNEIVVANFTNRSVTTYARLANGVVAPVRQIIGAMSGSHELTAIAVDPVNDEILLCDFGSIVVY